jgi:hypothetical protein
MRIVKLFQASGDDPNPRCTAYPGERRDKPVFGMTIPCGIAVLDVHGYIGIPLPGRSQIWTRARH